MKQELRNLVRQRSGDECEYCGVAQESEPFLRFHIEHIIPRQHGGLDTADDLALACPHCNFHKGTNLAGVDPETVTRARCFIICRTSASSSSSTVDLFPTCGSLTSVVMAALTLAGKALDGSVANGELIVLVEDLVPM